MYPRSKVDAHNDGFALLLVVAIIALLSVTAVTFLGTTSKNVTTSKAAALEAQATPFTEIAARQVIQDTLSEIRAGSVEPTPSAANPILYPATPWSAVPNRVSVESQSGASPPNLVKQSKAATYSYDAALQFNACPVYPQASAYPPAQRASSISTGTSGTAGTPAITPQRWNKPLLLPRQNPASRTDLTPATTGTLRFGGSSTQTWQWTPPDWIYLCSDGSNPQVFSNTNKPGAASPVVARYAFQMYDIGGLLDANVAGYDPDPLVVGTAVASRRGSIGLADLTQAGLTSAQLKRLLAFRNPATLAEADTGGFGHRYVNFLLNGKKNLGFLRVNTPSTGVTTPNKAFASRSELIAFIQSLSASSTDTAQLLESLQTLTHFSRSLEQPSFRPGFYYPSQSGSTPLSPVFTRPTIVPPAERTDDTLYPITCIPTTGTASLWSGSPRRACKFSYPSALGNNRGGNDAWGTLSERGISIGSNSKRALQDVINPAFLELVVSTQFTRQDGTTARTGEPLLKNRFPLERLSWVTYKGPSASLSKTDPLYNADGTNTAIKNCLGLIWMQDADGTFFWAYDHGKTGGIFTLEELLVSDPATQRPREPDLFETLKAGVAVGSLAKSAVPNRPDSSNGSEYDPTVYIQCRDRVSDFQVIEIGANLIDQSDADSFPTIIRLPHSDPTLGSSGDRYNPPLFTARGVEDLPYFYRFHIRGIEDPSDKPSPALPAPGGAIEITDKLAQYAGGAFKCGTTVVMGFPELWNPHAVDFTKPFDASKFPSAFRVVAAGEAPKDAIVAAKDSTDRGLSTLPKLGLQPVPSTSSAYEWTSILGSSLFEFLIKSTGFFGYAASSSIYSLLEAASHVGIQKYDDTNPPMRYRYSDTQLWEWPFDNVKLTALTDKTGTLFWSNAPACVAGSLAAGSKEITYMLGAISLYALPALDSSGNIPLEATPSGSSGTWPATSGTYASKITTVASANSQGQTDLIYKIQNQSGYYLWTSGSLSQSGTASQSGTLAQGGTFTALTYPRAPKISTLPVASSYMLRPSSLTYYDGGAVPNPIPPYLIYRRALTDRAGVQRRLFRTSLSITAPGTASPSDAGNISSRAIDLRGTELTFNIASNNLFREPTTLCNTDLPSGSNLKAGPDNFFSGAPYNGCLTDASGTKWVGFSLGEVPTNFILLTKLFKTQRSVQLASNGTLVWRDEYAGIPQDLPQTKTGDINIPNGTTPYYFRYFQVPVTTTGVDDTYFTLRLQFKDPNGKWVTYDERYLAFTVNSSMKKGSSPVLGRKELALKSPWTPQTSTGDVAWIENAQPLRWMTPVVTSYDPRTPRFGNPARIATTNSTAVQGTDPRLLQSLSITNANPSGLFPSGGASDRPSNTYVDLSSATGSAMTMTPNTLTPASWSSYFLTAGSTGLNYADTYNYYVSTNYVYGGKNAQGQALFKKPSPNAFDYGWYPRLASLTEAQGASSPTTLKFKPLTTTDPTLPNFAQTSTSTNGYADALRMGALSENIPPSDATAADPNAPYRQAYADPDDVIRRASGALSSTGGYYNSDEGLPMANGNNKTTSRPVILNRPFRSVAEMGYTFRGTPWKNIAFFLPETGDAALLDLFCITAPPAISGGTLSSGSGSLSAPPLIAGKVNLNTRQEPVLRALLAGALKDEFLQTESLPASTDAAKAAAALLDRTTGTKAWLGPLTNISELAGKLFGKDLSGLSASDPVYSSTVQRTSTEPNRNPDMQSGKSQLSWHFTGYSADLDSVFSASKDRKTQRLRESAIRALADCGQTRVWNLMLDLVVQAGGLTRNATSLASFQKNAEERVWVCLAIDRFTGQILEQKIEWPVE